MNTRPVDSGIRVGVSEIQTATAIAAVRWGLEQFGSRLCLLASMQDAVLIDIVMQVDRTTPVVFLDTGYHFPETLQTVARVEARYDIGVEVIGPVEPPRRHVEPGECCDTKPALLERALAGRSAWMSGIRRCETESRTDADIVETDRRGLVKINPIAQWADRDVAAYTSERDIIVNPLRQAGYTSIGCRPCTGLPGVAGGRTGRWFGSDRTECGLHL